MEFLMRIFGDYTAFVVISSREFVAYFICVVFSSVAKNKRKYYPLRLAACFAVGLLMCIPIGVLRTTVNNLGGKILCGSIIAFMTAPMLMVLLYRETFTEYCLCWTGIVASKGISGNLFALLLNACGRDDLTTMSFFDGSNIFVDWLINILIQLVILALIYTFLHKYEKSANALPNRVNSIILAVTAFLLNNILYPVVHNYQDGNFALAVCCKILVVVIYLFVLMVRAGLFSHGVTAAKLNVAEQLLSVERKRYAEVKDNVDVINMKCHDIKRQLSSLQGKLTDEEIAALKDAIQIYDSSIKTGSEILDLVLYQKLLYCENHGIKLDCIADGKALGFIGSQDLYALLANAVENAIEATENLDPDKRVISLNVRKDNGKAIIETANYRAAASSPDGSNTTKPDKQHHGYGIMSMRYIANMYGGTLSVSTDDDMFFLRIEIPLKESAAE